MLTKTKQWADGSSATIQYDGQGDGQIIITSDANSLYEARSMQITVETTDGSGIQKVVTINQAAKQRIDLSAAVVTAATQTYSGSAKTPTPTVTLNGSTVPSSGYDVAYSNNTNAGTATITVTGKGDYTGTATGTFTINKANPTYTAPKARSLTYSGSAQYLTTTGSTSHGTIQYSSDRTNWYTTRRQGTNAGGYTIYWRLVGDSNHNDVASTSISVTIAKASRTITFTYQPVTLYVGESKTLAVSVSAGSNDGTITISSSNNNVSISGYTMTGMVGGGVYIYANISEGSNYLSASTYYSLTVAYNNRHGATLSESLSNNTCILTNGSEVSSPYYDTTGFIAVTPGERLQFRSSGSYGMYCYSAYTSNSQSSISKNNSETGVDDGVHNLATDYDVTIPPGIFYIRICNDSRVLNISSVDIYFV